VTYSIKVATRNVYGYGELSEAILILAAQEPFQPQAPISTLNNDQVVFTWVEPLTGGSPITSYHLTILQKDGVTYTPDLVNCDAQEYAIASTLTCQVPVSVLLAEPYVLTWADPVYAKLSASNIYGTGVYSEAGNGAILHTIPDPPSTFEEDL
jgi:hypothetical protein